eukprot:gnl/Chilomastix_cuspidata/655.p1 GENE.gnl/Chilomastix_cuspidata/655~~gnl/Chilomastix_cuspidata/655.p1  ORF type:complete len:771 (+),score=282.21 gnl/Chilomastix_cuspidata/655:46-2358(+)
MPPQPQRPKRGANPKPSGEKRPPQPKHTSRRKPAGGAQPSIQTQKIVKPPNQLDLTEKQLDEEHTRMLTANNPNAPDNIVQFSYKEQMFKLKGMVSQAEFHIAMDGDLILRDGEEAKQQEEFALSQTKAGRKGRPLRNQFNFSVRGTQTFTAPPRSREVTTEPPPSDVLRGMFSRSIIYDAYMAKKKEEEIQGAATQAKRTRRKEETEKETNLEFAEIDRIAQTSQDAPQVPGSVRFVNETEIAVSLRIAERMVSENVGAEITTDFRYWDNPADEYQPGEGSLLPLWTFRCPGIQKTICAIECHPMYHDLFAVAYGTHQFLQTASSPSKIALFTLKSTMAPEITIPTPSDCLCLAWHPEQPNLLAAGFYDGSVAVYEIRHKKHHELRLETSASSSQQTQAAGRGSSTAATSAGSDTFSIPSREYAVGEGFTLICRANAETGKHLDPVWEICWQPNSSVADGRTFHSASSDGTVKSWTLAKRDLRMISSMDLRQPASDSLEGAVSADDAISAAAALGVESAMTSTRDAEATRQALVGANESGTNVLSPCSGAMSLVFSHSPATSWLYCVGTDTGPVRVCSTAYTSHYMQSFLGHSMAVYSLDFNRWDNNLLLSGSEDWTVRIWQKDRTGPIATFDIGQAVQDAKWSPHSSSVFAAVGLDGVVFVYDLAMNKQAPLCRQPILREGRPSKLVFSPKYPVLFVGDSVGSVHCLKLSPNLRNITRVEQPKPVPGQPPPVPLSKEEIERRVLAGENQKLKDFVSFSLQSNRAAGLE